MFLRQGCRMEQLDTHDVSFTRLEAQASGLQSRVAAKLTLAIYLTTNIHPHMGTPRRKQTRIPMLWTVSMRSKTSAVGRASQESLGIRGSVRCGIVPCFCPATPCPSLTEGSSPYARLSTTANAIDAQLTIRVGYTKLCARTTAGS